MNQRHSSWKQQFAIIYAGQAFSLVGSSAVQFAVIWWLTVQTGSAITLTVATLVAFIPNMFIGPFAGVWIDRYNRRWVMIAADGVVALSSLMLAAAFLLTESPPLWFLYLVLLVRGVGNTFHGPAMQAAIPLLVPAEMLTKAGGWSQLINSLSNMVGPALGAALMTAVPLAGIMVVDIAGALVACVCLLFVAIPDVPRTGERPHFWSDAKEGFGALRANRPLMAILPPMLLVNILYMPLGVLFPLLIHTHFGGGAWHNSVAEILFAGGMLAASLVLGVWGGMRRRFLMVSLSVGLLGATSLLSGALPPSGFWVFAAACFLMGSSGAFFNVPMMAYTQESVPPQMLGKVFSLIMTATTLAMPIGLLVSGPASEAVGVHRWFFWSGAALVATALLCYLRTRPYDRPGAEPQASEQI